MLGVSQQQSGSVLGGVAPNISSNAGTFGESCSDMSALTSVFKGLSPDQPQTPGKTKIMVGESINQRCDLMLSEQLSHLQDIQSALEENLDIIETEAYTDPEKYIARAQNLFEQAQNGSVLVACIGKMQTELQHTRQDLQKLIASSDRDALTRAQDRVKWLENRIEQVLLLHRQSVLEGKRAKMTSSLAHSSKYGSSSSELKSGSSGEKVEESVYNMVSLGPLPFTDESIGREDTTVTTKSVKSTKSAKSQKSKAASTATTRFTVPSARSEDNPESSLWSKKSGPQPLWHTLPLVPRSPITLSCTPFDRNVPWLDRRGSSYDLLREEYNQLMDKVAKVYTHIQYVVDSSHETDVNINSPTNVSSRMSRQGGDGKDDYDCYGLDPPVPLKWGRLSRSQSNIYPRPTRTWHNGIYLEPVRRIANQQQNQQGSMSRQSTFTSGGKSESIRIFSRSKLLQAKRRVLASVSLQKLNRITLARRNNNELSSGVTTAQKERIMFLINENLKSEIAKVRKEAVRDLGILYKTRQEFAVVNALKETVYTDDNIFVLIEASKSLLSIGVWDCAALEIVLQAIKYGSQGLRFTLLEALRTSSNPNSVNKQSVQFRVLQGLLLNLIRRGSHVPQTEESKGPTFTLPTDTPSLLLKLQKENKNIGGADNDSLAAHAALVCAAFLIIDDEVKECLLHLLKKGSEDLQSWSLTALVTKLNHHPPEVIRSCLSLMKSAVKSENRAAATELIVDLKQAIENNGLSAQVFDGLQLMLYDDFSREVRQTVAKVTTSLGLHAKMVQVVVRKLDDINEDVRGQGVMSLSILGIKGKSLLNQLLDILELDSSIFVRIQVMRAVKELNIADRRVIRLLRERARGTGPMCKEAQLALYTLTGELE